MAIVHVRVHACRTHPLCSQCTGTQLRTLLCPRRRRLRGSLIVCSYLSVEIAPLRCCCAAVARLHKYKGIQSCWFDEPFLLDFWLLALRFILHKLGSADISVSVQNCNFLFKKAMHVNWLLSRSREDGSQYFSLQVFFLSGSNNCVTNIQILENI